MLNLDSFARFFVRFYGLTFIFWAFYDVLDLPVRYENYRTIHELQLFDQVAAREFAVFVIRVALQLLVGLLLLGRTDRVITLILTGRWRDPVRAPNSNEPKG